MPPQDLDRTRFARSMRSWSPQHDCQNMNPTLMLTNSASDVLWVVE